jgi:hypothetical protein
MPRPWSRALAAYVTVLMRKIKRCPDPWDNIGEVWDRTSAEHRRRSHLALDAAFGTKPASFAILKVESAERRRELKRNHFCREDSIAQVAFNRRLDR